jgi:hypothetical protein
MDIEENLMELFEFRKTREIILLLILGWYFISNFFFTWKNSFPLTKKATP